MKTLQGKWSLVTGSSRGIGLYVSEGLAQLGSNLILHSRELAHNENIAEKLRSTGVQVVTVAGELSDQAQVDRFLDEALSKTAHIDVVYNNAAIVQMNLLDPGWLHTDLGGPNAPNDPSSVLPGALEKALAN